MRMDGLHMNEPKTERFRPVRHKKNDLWPLGGSWIQGAKRGRRSRFTSIAPIINLWNTVAWKHSDRTYNLQRFISVSAYLDTHG